MKNEKYYLVSEDVLVEAGLKKELEKPEYFSIAQSDADALKRKPKSVQLVSAGFGF